MEYTFSSSIEDGFSVIYAPINYLGASRQLRWHVSCVNGKANTVLLDTNDCVIVNKNIYYVKRVYTSLDALKTILDELLVEAGLTISVDSSGRYIIYGNKPFTITYMTPKLKYAFGLYYLNDINISSSEYNNGEQIIHMYQCQAIHFDYLTPIWYVVSNMGTPTQISSLVDRFRLYYPAINVKIINTFTDGQPLCISNCDYYTVSQASSLSNLRFQIMDSDMNPITFLTPIYITVNVEPIDADEAIEEAMTEQEQNPNFLTMFQNYLKMNTELMETLIAKTERGITAEPEYPPIQEVPQYNQPIIEHKPCEYDEGVADIDAHGPNISSDRPIIESYGEGNDDNTEQKETGTEQQEEHNVEENTIKVQEQINE